MVFPQLEDMADQQKTIFFSHISTSHYKFIHRISEIPDFVFSVFLIIFMDILGYSIFDIRGYLVFFVWVLSFCVVVAVVVVVVVVVLDL